MIRAKSDIAAVVIHFCCVRIEDKPSWAANSLESLTDCRGKKSSMTEGHKRISKCAQAANERNIQ